MKRKLPMTVVYHLANVLGTKGMKSKVTQLKEAVDKCLEIGDVFKHFTLNEWIFSNNNAYSIFKSLSDQEKMKFNFDVSRIKWRMYIMNFAYGIKRFILKEEAELPSAGYNDVVTVRFILIYQRT